MAGENKVLIDFEDTIRLDALPLSEALELKSKSKNGFYIVGEAINIYIGPLRLLGFKDLWKESEKGDASKVVRMSKTKQYSGGRNEDARLMNAYIDYVLNHTNDDLMVFLPEKSGIIAKTDNAGPTYDEIIRAIKFFPTHYERIHFVTGLYDINSEEILKNANDSI